MKTDSERKHLMMIKAVKLYQKGYMLQPAKLRHRYGK
jgi:hypothetical protein